MKSLKAGVNLMYVRYKIAVSRLGSNRSQCRKVTGNNIVHYRNQMWRNTAISLYSILMFHTVMLRIRCISGNYCIWPTMIWWLWSVWKLVSVLRLWSF